MLHDGDDISYSVGPGKQTKSSESASHAGAEVYDLSRFQKSMTKTQMLDLNLPSPPLLTNTDTHNNRYNIHHISTVIILSSL